jgi:molybdenum cofactor cytidylyltransferase
VNGGAVTTPAADRVVGLILAAGDGTRFGGEGFKLLAELNGRPLLEWAVRAQCAVAELDPVIVVLGAHAEEVAGQVDLGRARTVVCPDWAAGQSASLRCGLHAVRRSGADRVIVTLGDAPLVSPEVIAAFVGAPPRTRALYGGRPGHPVVLGPDEMAKLTRPRGDEGARGLLRGGPVIEVGHLCSGRDVDTPDDLQEVRHEARAVF